MDNVAGKLNYKGDIRAGMQPQLMYSERHGTIRPVAVEYDETTDLTTVTFTALDGLYAQS